MNFRISFLILIFVFCHPLFLNAQQKVDSLVKIHSPVKASIYSAILPGAGQFYNHKYWKIPVIYGAMAGLGYLAKTNNSRYTDFKTAYRYRIDGDSGTTDNYTDIYTDNDLKLLRDYYRRNRDLSLIFIGLFYVLNIVDASVDAHLYYFDISDDLSLNLAPAVYSQGGIGICLGLKLR